MQVSKVPADRIVGEIGAEGRAEPGQVGRCQQKVILANLNADFWIVAEQFRALGKVGVGENVFAVRHATALDQVGKHEALGVFGVVDLPDFADGILPDKFAGFTFRTPRLFRRWLSTMTFISV